MLDVRIFLVKDSLKTFAKFGGRRLGTTAEIKQVIFFPLDQITYPCRLDMLVPQNVSQFSFEEIVRSRQMAHLAENQQFKIGLKVVIFTHVPQICIVFPPYALSPSRKTKVTNIQLKELSVSALQQLSPSHFILLSFQGPRSVGIYLRLILMVGMLFGTGLRTTKLSLTLHSN